MTPPRSTATFKADDAHLRQARDFLVNEHGLEHLRVRKRADLLTIESGPKDDPYQHARIRRVGQHLWRLEMATHSGRWQPTPLTAPPDQLLAALVDSFGWTLQPIA